jgi:ABC-type glycerol-3-phosphate transport system permease component
MKRFITLRATAAVTFGGPLMKSTLLFMNIFLITISPLILFILFIFFNRKIVSGMTAGAVKG